MNNGKNTCWLTVATALAVILYAGIIILLVYFAQVRGLKTADDKYAICVFSLLIIISSRPLWLIMETWYQQVKKTE